MQQGFSPVQRKPVIGRTGPDYTFNELELVIDEKSRLEVPKSCLCPASEIIQIGDNLLGVRIADLNKFLDLWVAVRKSDNHSKIVCDYYSHMKEWQVNHLPNGLTVVVLHKPHMPFRNATFVISEQDRRRLYGRIIDQQRARAQGQVDLRPA
jgi:hypothetical protein